MGCDGIAGELNTYYVTGECLHRSGERTLSNSEPATMATEYRIVSLLQRQSKIDLFTELIVNQSSNSEPSTMATRIPHSEPATKAVRDRPLYWARRHSNIVSLLPNGIFDSSYFPPISTGMARAWDILGKSTVHVSGQASTVLGGAIETTWWTCHETAMGWGLQLFERYSCGLDLDNH